MRVNRRTATALAVSLVILFVLLTSSSVFALPKASKIELADGSVYHDVLYIVDNAYRIVTISTVEKDWDVSFTEIVAIIDEDGEDVTVEALGGDYRPARKAASQDLMPTPAAPVEQPAAETPEVRQSIETSQVSISEPTEAAQKSMLKSNGRTSPFDVGVQVNVGFGFPYGTWFEGFNPGIGFGADVFIRLTHDLALRGTVSKAGIKLDELSRLDYWQVLSDDRSVSVMRYYLSLQYYKWKNWRRGGKTMWYAYCGMGMVSHKFSGTMIVHDPYEGSDYLVYMDSKAINKFSSVTGGGLTHLLTERTAIQCGLTWDLLFIGKVENDDGYSGLYGDVQTASILELQVGIVQYF